MVTSMEICHAKPYTLRGGPSTKLEQRSDSQTGSILYLRSSRQNRDRGTQPHESPLKSWDAPTITEYFSEDYDEEREMEPIPEPTRAATSPLRIASPRNRRWMKRKVGISEEAPRGDGGQSVNLPLLLAAHLGRGENGQPLQPSLTSAYGGQALPNNIGGNLPSNGTFLSHHAQPFIPISLNISNGFMPTHIHPYQQPTSYVNGQHLSFPMQTPSGNLPMGGIPAHLPQGGRCLESCGFGNTFYTLDRGLTPPDRLKMPSYIGSYDGKGHPDNFLHIFEGAIRMQKLLMPVACHMFTYTLKDSARIWWNNHKTCNILDYEDLKAKFRSHFSQQKKFTKTTGTRS
ncbi:hypothetical protein Tco_0567362 [Tanacetum coccineum]